jgi:hypothetical protein
MPGWPEELQPETSIESRFVEVMAVAHFDSEAQKSAIQRIGFVIANTHS